MDEELRQRLAAHLCKESAGIVEITQLEPLPGGACQELWRVHAKIGGGDRRLVLRADARTSIPGSIDRESEARVVSAAVARGVRTPDARWFGRDLLREGGNGYFMDWVDGEAIGRRVTKSPQLAQAREKLPSELAHELALIHSITPRSSPSLFPQTPGDPVRALIARIRGMLDLVDPRPAVEIGLRWLEKHAPSSSEVTLVHGDFRVGNFMVGSDGLHAILDWEFAHWGTPADDLAWISVRDWRFGNVEKPIGGIASRAPFYQAYERESGRKVDRDEVHYWEVAGNLGWAVASLHQGLRYFAGDRDIELLAVARRALEMEYEALRLIDRGPRA
jgi:aminoglycoside phosphotransferase (APT) family kinase protein